MATKRDEQAADYRAEASDRVAPAPPAAVKIEQIERVTLEFAFDYRSNFRPSEWVASLRPGALCPGLSVRVVKDEGRQEPPSTKEAAVENDCDTAAPAGRRTDRVTLDIEHWGDDSAARWDFNYCLRALYALESVRVVEEPNFEVLDRIATLTDQRDTAIREREQLRGERDRANDKHQSYRQTALARVAELEAEGKKLRQCPECIGEGQHDCGARDQNDQWTNSDGEPCEGCASAGTIVGFVAVSKTLRGRVQKLEVEEIGLRGDVRAAEKETERLREQLESVADRAAAAELALDAVPAASGGVLDSEEVFQRLHNWRHSHYDEDGYQPGLNDLIGKEAMEDLVDCVCDVTQSAPAASGGGVVESVTVETQPMTAKETRAISDALLLREPQLRQAEAARLLVRERDEAVAKAASGGGEAEADAWGVRMKSGTYKGFLFPSREQANKCAELITDEVVAFFEAPPQPRGWLKEGERNVIENVMTDHSDEDFKVFRNLLARSSPPEVVKPGPWKAVQPFPGYPSWQPFLDQFIANRDKEWLAALVAAGLPVKEVG